MANHKDFSTSHQIVSHTAQNVIDSLRHRRVDSIPRGELFLGRDYLDRFFPQLMGDYPRQLRHAAERLDLSAVGVDLNSQASRRALAIGEYEVLADKFAIGFVNGPFSRLVEAEGFMGAMMSTRRKPSLLSDLAGRLIEEVDQIAKYAAEKGLRALAIADDIAGKNGLLFSPEYFSTSLLPHYKAFAEIVKGNDLFVFLHSDGDMRKPMEAFIQAGYDCIHPVDVQGGLNIEELRIEFGGRVTFMGHVDIMAWDIERITQEMKTAEKSFKTGGLILGSTGGLSADLDQTTLSVLHPANTRR
jgi:uroporphyrinogen-III decarboxylase